MSTGKNGTAEHKFSVSEEHINQWRNYYNFIFSCRVTKICFMRPREIRYLKVWKSTAFQLH